MEKEEFMKLFKGLVRSHQNFNLLRSPSETIETALVYFDNLKDLTYINEAMQMASKTKYFPKASEIISLHDKIKSKKTTDSMSQEKKASSNYCDPMTKEQKNVNDFVYDTINHFHCPNGWECYATELYKLTDSKTILIPEDYQDWGCGLRGSCKPGIVEYIRSILGDHSKYFEVKIKKGVFI